MRYFFLSVMLAVSLLGVAQAELTFETLHLEQTAKPEDQVLPFQYTFTNESEKPVKISNINAGCSCLKVVGLEKKTYLPGETGVIALDFALGTFTGKVDKTLFLWYNDAKRRSPSEVLRATVNIPALLEIGPKTLKWLKDSEATTQILKVSVHKDEPVQLSNIICSNSNFKVELVTKKAGFEYEFEVTPVDTSKIGFGIIKFETDAKASRFKRGQAFMVIRKNLNE